ncbi:MAG: tRNA pseudouridine(38-40) synthase TruA [Myxococcales bacterium]|nr:tRNA pseudouridine(38-40) synthase TruA [Myxococcales bacterium]
MPRIKLTLEYEGTAYVGWQVQPNGPSVQELVEAALAELLGGRVRVEAAGRTDAGVHALGQVACFTSPRELPLTAYTLGLNGLLPEDIAVLRAEEVPPDFDPRRWSLGKRYRYLISNRRGRSPLRRRTHWELFQPLDLVAMREAAACLVGRYDFSSFRAAVCQAKHPVREIRALAIEGASGDELSVTVDGTAFLRHMVRNLVGSLAEVGKGRRPIGWMAEVLEARDRTRSGPTAPAHGLYLVEVFYGQGRPQRLVEED